MTTQATTIRRDKSGIWGAIGTTALTLALLGGVALWQARHAGEIPAPMSNAVSSTVDDGAGPLGGMTERYAELEREAAAQRAARVTTTSGMAEVYAARAAKAAAIAELEGRIGGMAELYRYQAQPADGAH